MSSEVDRLLHFARAGTYYELLGVQPDTPRPAMKQRFYHLASRFHPDHHMDHPERTARLLVLMDALNTAYRTLSDDKSKRRYDSCLVQAPAQESLEPQRIVQECLAKAMECLAVKNYIGSIIWLHRVIEAEPYSSSYRAMLGSSLAAVPEYRQEAVEQFQKAIELDPLDVAAHFQYAQLLEHMELPSLARLHYVHILELDANHREARERLKRLDTGATRSSSRSSLLGRLASRFSV